MIYQRDHNQNWSHPRARPRPGDGFDLVVHVESPHCHPSMTAFVAEISRVLKPAHSFGEVTAVLDKSEHMPTCPALEVPNLLAGLSEGPLVLKSIEDITADVLEALRVDNTASPSSSTRWCPAVSPSV